MSDIEIRAVNVNSYEQTIGNMLSKYNAEVSEYFKEAATARIDPYKETPYSLIALDHDKFIGGATGYIKYGWYYLDLLCIDKEYRGKGIGTRILTMLETHMKDIGFVGIRTETWDFQALDFYKNFGFEVYGELKDCPKGTVTYYLSLRLSE